MGVLVILVLGNCFALAATFVALRALIRLSRPDRTDAI